MGPALACSAGEGFRGAGRRVGADGGGGSSVSGRLDGADAAGLYGLLASRHFRVPRAESAGAVPAGSRAADLQGGRDPDVTDDWRALSGESGAEAGGGRRGQGRSARGGTDLP